MGGGLITVLLGTVLAHFMANVPYLTCPVEAVTVAEAVMTDNESSSFLVDIVGGWRSVAEVLPWLRVRRECAQDPVFLTSNLSVGYLNLR